MLKSICFQQVHWRSIVSRTCRRSQRATSIARRLPRQRRQENGSEWHFCTTSCSAQLQLGNVSTTDGVCPSSCKSNEFFLNSADAFHASCRWTSPPHQGQNVEQKRRSRLNCFPTGISCGCAVNKTCVEVLFLSRLTWIQERLKWWRLHPGLASTQPFNFQVFIKRDEIQEEESILTTARVLTRASLQQWRVEQTVVHFSSIQVSRNGTFHNHKFH